MSNFRMILPLLCGANQQAIRLSTSADRCRCTAPASFSECQTSSLGSATDLTSSNTAPRILTIPRTPIHTKHFHSHGLPSFSPAPTRQIMASDDEPSICDQIEIEDMTFDATLQLYTYPCPCGDRFERSSWTTFVTASKLPCVPPAFLWSKLPLNLCVPLLHAGGFRQRPVYRRTFPSQPPTPQR